MDEDLVPVRFRSPTMQKIHALRGLTEEGVEYWRARDLVTVLGYSSFAKINDVLDRVRDALANNGQIPSHHIALTGKMVLIGSGAKRETTDFFLTRAACYLLAMNGDPSKAAVADAQAYFAVRAHEAEQAEAVQLDNKRLEGRERVRKAALRVADVAQNKGVKRFSLFHNARYEGLYERSTRQVNREKGVPEGESLLNYAGPLELMAHGFQMELASEKLSADFQSGEDHAIKTNREVAKRVRQTMIDEVGHGPEKLPLEKESIQALEASRQRHIKPA